MRKLLLPIFIIIAASCKREPLTTYNAEDSVYFNYSPAQGVYIDSIDFSFAYSPLEVQDTLLPLPIAVTGVSSANDRTFKLIIDPASTAIEGTHYEFPETIFHAGKVQDTLRIRVKRSADLGTAGKKLIVSLQPNETLKTDLKYRVISGSRDTIDVTSFAISMSDMLSEGPYWNVYTNYFGTFSVKKVRLINELLDMPLDFWLNPSVFSYQRSMAIYYASTTARYLSEQAEAGNTIYDEDGSPMKMGLAYP